MLVLSFLIQLFGLWLLSMAMNKHFRYTFSKSLTPKLEQLLSILGYAGIGVSFILICLLKPLPLMMIYWVSYLALNIALIALLNSFKESRYNKRA